jgi:hypothetical protein
MTQRSVRAAPEHNVYDLSEEEIAKLAELAVQAKQKAYCMASCTCRLTAYHDPSNGSLTAGAGKRGSRDMASIVSMMYPPLNHSRVF